MHQLHRASTLPLGPKSLKVKCQTFPHDGLVDWPGLLSPLQDWGSGPLSPLRSPPACHRYHHGAGAKGATGCGRLVQEFLGRHGATYSVLTSYSGAFSSQTCTILDATGKAITKRFNLALLCCWGGKIFSHQFLVVPECPTPLLGRDILTKLETTLVMGSFPAPRAL